MSHLKDAISAAAKCDKLTRRNRVDAHAAKLDELVATNTDVLEAYNKGPTGNIEKDQRILGESVFAMVRGIYLGKKELEARIEQIRNHDDILRGLVPKLYSCNYDDRLSHEVHEYVRRIQDERKRCTVPPNLPNDYLAVPCTPGINSKWGTYKWFHRGVVFYQDDLTVLVVQDVLPLSLKWSEFAATHATDIVDVSVNQIPCDWDSELQAQLEEDACQNS